MIKMEQLSVIDQKKSLFKINSKYEELYGFHDPEHTIIQTQKGLTKEIVEEISKIKGEPKWMLDFRLKSLEIFLKKPMPTWGADLSMIDFNNIIYYMKSNEKKATNWEDVPENIKKTFDRLGIPEAERKFLAGVGGQYDSENIIHRIQEDLAKQGVIFSDIETGLKECPDIIREHFATVVPPEDNKFAALNSACWSGGSFVYIPKGVHVNLPLQAYFRINAQNFGQFERTLIIAEPGSRVHYVEGCSAPVYATDSLHTAVVEVIAKENSKVRYTTIQNWSSNVFNLVTKRAHAHARAIVEWLDANLGSKITMKFPSVYLLGPNARADIVSVAFASKGQHQDAGGKAIHFAPNTSSKIISKSISMDGGRTSYRGLVNVAKGATGCSNTTRCDALMLDDKSRSDTYPYIEIEEDDATIAHEATVGKIGEDQIFYLMSRGLKESEARAMIVLGFIEQFTKELPMEYAVEMNRLIQLEMEGAIG